MKFTLTSIKKKILEIDNLEQAIIPTKAGEITVLSFHVPLISALKPGILKIKFDWKEQKFAVWGWVVEIDWKHLSILADMVEDWVWLNLDEIESKKLEAKKLMDEMNTSWKKMDMERYIELELEYLKESAKEQLAIR